MIMVLNKERPAYKKKCGKFKIIIHDNNRLIMLDNSRLNFMRVIILTLRNLKLSNLWPLINKYVKTIDKSKNCTPLQRATMSDGVKYEIILSGIGFGSITLQEDKFSRNKTF